MPATTLGKPPSRGERPDTPGRTDEAFSQTGRPQALRPAHTFRRKSHNDRDTASEPGNVTHVTGIVAIGWMFMLVGAVTLVLQFGQYAGTTAPMDAGALVLAAVAVLTGAGLARKRGWGWWTACCLLYMTILQSAALLIGQLLDGAPAAAFTPGLVIGTSVLAVGWLSRGVVMGSVRFGERWTPIVRSRVSPATAAFAALFLMGILQAVSGM